MKAVNSNEFLILKLPLPKLMVKDLSLRESLSGKPGKDTIIIPQT